MKFGLMELLILFFTAFSLGATVMSTVRYSDAELNKLEGYHCQPIQKVEALEEAKAIVKQYQERVK